MKNTTKLHFERELQIRTRQLILSQLALNEATQQLEAYWRGIRHDLHSPIQQLDKVVDFLERDPIENKEELIAHSRALIERLQFSFEKISILVDLNLLDENPAQEINLQKLLDDCFEKLTPISRKQTQSLYVDFSEMPVLWYQENFLRSIFYNLVELSIASIAAHHPVTWKASQKNSIRVLEIKGLAQEMINLSSDGNTRFQASAGGVQLNLAIVNELVEHKNGQLRILKVNNLLNLQVQF